MKFKWLLKRYAQNVLIHCVSGMMIKKDSEFLARMPKLMPQHIEIHFEFNLMKPHIYNRPALPGRWSVQNSFLMRSLLSGLIVPFYAWFYRKA